MTELLFLSQYIEALKEAGLLLTHPSLSQEEEALTIQCLTFDTRSLKGRTLFICKGAHFKEEYLAFAACNGAVCYVSEKVYDVGIPAILVKDIRKAMPILAKLHFRAADDALLKIGITGTKGKSTTAYFVRSIFNCAMKRLSRPACAVLSSIENYDGESLEESHLTTPESVELFRHFDAARRSGITHLVMEASSQGLKYDRLTGVTFRSAAFLNIGSDHISPVEHSDAEDYLTAKMRIFDHCESAVVGYDLPMRRRVLAYIGDRVPTLTFGRSKDADVYAYDIEKKGGGFSFRVRTPQFDLPFSIRIPGLFNVDNALAAIALCLFADISPEDMQSGLAEALVSGRMEVFESNDERVTVIVDYAHNKMSFEALFDSVRKEYPGRQIIAVFGCPGGKAQGRRVDLPEISGRYAKHVIITEEDSGEEPFDNIAADISASLDGRTAFSIVEDRGDAIREAILERGKDSVILVTGKGEETRQKRGTLYIDCPSDVDYTKRYLDEYNRLPETAAQNKS